MIVTMKIYVFILYNLARYSVLDYKVNETEWDTEVEREGEMEGELVGETEQSFLSKKEPLYNPYN